MHHVDKDWIKKQMGKAISAEESVLRSERDNRERIEREDLAKVYDLIIRDDEKHLHELKKIAGKYGVEEGTMMESLGGIMGAVKTAAESFTTTDLFQTIGDDLMLKSNAVNYDHAWTKIFREVGDDESASVMELAAREDEEHQHMMRETLTSVGLMEAHGEEVEE